MKRWGLVGLVAMVACAPEDTSSKNAQGGVCPNVSAGALEAGPPGKASGPATPKDDGRQSYIVRFHDGGVSAAAQVHQLGGRVTATYRSVPAVAARLTEHERDALAKDSRVESIEPDQVWHSLGLATVPARAFAAATVKGSTAEGEYTEGLRQVQANQVWDVDGDGQPDPGRPTGRGVRVCIIDSGLDLEHPELRGAVVAGHDFLDGDDEPWDGRPGAWGTGHGTHVAGIVAARAGSGAEAGKELTPGRGLIGVAPEVELVIARVLDVYGSTQMSSVLEALEYCSSQGAKVASLSLGGGFASRTTLQAFKAAYSGGMLVVAAAGNDGGKVVSYPASDPSVVAVGAVDAPLGRRAPFSTGGDDLALMAPGVDVLSTFPRGWGTLASIKAGDTSLLTRALLYAPPGEYNQKLVDCGGAETTDSCAGSACSGFIAYVRPGHVSVEQAMVNVMVQGAKAVIFSTDDVEGGAQILSVPQGGTWVPAVTINHGGSTKLHWMFDYPVRIDVDPADYTYMSGTSMAAPHVSGVAALLFSAHPSASPDQVKQALLSTAKDLGARGFDTDYGNGLVQAKAALDALDALSPLP